MRMWSQQVLLTPDEPQSSFILLRIRLCCLVLVEGCHNAMLKCVVRNAPSSDRGWHAIWRRMWPRIPGRRMLSIPYVALVFDVVFVAWRDEYTISNMCAGGWHIQVPAWLIATTNTDIQPCPLLAAQSGGWLSRLSQLGQVCRSKKIDSERMKFAFGRITACLSFFSRWVVVFSRWIVRSMLIERICCVSCVVAR